MTTARRIVQFDYANIEGRLVTAVLGVADIAPKRWLTIAFVLGSDAVVLGVDEDTDEVVATLAPFGQQPVEAWIPVAALERLVGNELGWSWESRNSQGYADMFTVSCDGIDPRFAFLAAASALQCLVLTPAE